MERAPARRSSGYLVNLLGRATTPPSASACCPRCPPTTWACSPRCWSRADGRPKFTVPAAIAEAALGKRAMSVFRGDLESTLYEAVRDRTEIRFGTTVTAVDQDADGVRVTLSDGTTEHADLLVGADGVHSATRTAVFGAGFRVDLPYVVAAFPLTHPVPGVAGVVRHHVHRPADAPRRSSTWARPVVGVLHLPVRGPRRRPGRGPVDALGAAFGDLGGACPTRSATSRDPAERLLRRGQPGGHATGGAAAGSCCSATRPGASRSSPDTARPSRSPAPTSSAPPCSEHGDDVPAALAGGRPGCARRSRKRQALARRGMLQYAPPSRFHVWMSDLTIRAITLPGVRGLVRRAAR